MNEIKRMIRPFEVKMLEDGASNIGKFEGYASVWGSVDLGWVSLGSHHERII